MEGYTTSFINLITDNLRDRYDNGLPIIKELVQNADDAGARRLLIGRHEGFPDAKQPLLKGSGLWLFNNGGFKPSDKQALRAFGINAKAGDSTSIGKFGLGMKSVFHLCEALFYVAFDGSDHHHVGLTPWIQDGRTPHPEWNETDDRDWALLQSLAERKVHDDDPSWFMLWIPLRRREQLARADGTETGAIIQRFPGDDPTPDLGFMSDARFGSDLAEMLPLLRHLEIIGYESADNPFEINVQCHSRLMVDNQEKASGEIVTDSGSIKFAGKRRQSTDVWFEHAKQCAVWPRTRYRDENQQEHEAPDKALPEAAAVFCSGTEHGSDSSLHWAVFLPLQEGGERLHIGGTNQRHNLVLHGQFFVDAGRKKLHDGNLLADTPIDLAHEEMDDGRLRRAWNQRLAQQVQAPLVLPALHDYVAIQKLSDHDTAALTEALHSSDWFNRFRGHACRQQAWVRRLVLKSKPGWQYIVGSDVNQLRPVPRPPVTAPDRPWVLFPGLTTGDWLPFDASAPALLDGSRQWRMTELEQLFENIPSVFGDGPLMDYLAEFLEKCAGVYRETGWFQNTLIALLRNAFADSTPPERNKVRQSARRLVAFIAPQNRLELNVEVPPDALRGLWRIDAPILLVPRGFDADAHSEGRPPQETLVRWLEELNRQISQLSADYHGDLLTAIQQLLRTLPSQDLASFLRSRPNLSVIRVTNALTARRGVASFAELEGVHKAGRLLGFAQGINDAARMGLAAPLARVLPQSNVWLVSAGDFRNLMPNGKLPSAENPTACLEAIAKDDSGVLSGIAERKALLERANDPRDSDIAIRGLRYALHGSPNHRDDTAPLWAPALNQHPVWAKLWGSLNPNEAWTLIDKDLIDAIPRARWHNAIIQEINATNLLHQLEAEGTDIPSPEDFNDSERDEILDAIEDSATWSRLTLHTTVDGTLVSAAQPGVYLARSVSQEGDSLTQLATFIQPSENLSVARQQHRWLKPLDELGRIELALGAPSPAEFWLDIMNAVADLDDESDWPFLQALRETSWLPTQYDAISAGEDVIDLDGALHDAAQRVTSEHRTQHGTVFVVPTDLKPEVAQHLAWPKLRRHAFATQDRGVERLAMVLEELPRYHIGGWHRQPADEVIEFMTRCDELPGWEILHAAGQHLEGFDDAWRLLRPGLNHPLKTKRLTSVLEWLTSDRQDWPMRKEAHDRYLANWTQQADPLSNLAPSQLLAAENRTWRPASQLCVGANGIDPDSVLDNKQASALGSRITHAGAPPTPTHQTATTMPAGFAQRVQAAEPLLRDDYFRSWQSAGVPAPMLGTLVALLGPALRGLAEDYLESHSFDWLRDKLPWQSPAIDPMAPEWMGGKTISEGLDLIEAAIQVPQGDRVDVLNLLGEPMSAPLHQQPKTLLAGSLNWEGGFGVTVPLRRIDPTSLPTEQAEQLLRSTAEHLYQQLYNQKRPSFDELWRELDKSDQLQLDAARRLILDSVPFYLQQLDLGDSAPKLREAIRHHDQCRYRLSEAEQEGQDTEQARKKLANALKALVDRIEQDTAASRAVLDGFKAKLAHFQYDRASIPFELFQNADDAAVELGSIEAYPTEDCEVPFDATRFIVDVEPNRLRFLHWGRPINARGPVGFDGDGRGYGRDLEKMLIMAASEKHARTGVTGKFGLGFKSVLLACDHPRILSGRLAFEVVGGILPRAWNDAEGARRALEHHGPSAARPGTVIELNGLDLETQDAAMKLFNGLSGILCAFGRAIRSVTVQGNPVMRRTWSPSKLTERIEFGQLQLTGPWGTQTDALCFRADTGALLLALSPEGFRPFPDSVPTLWVTAPTREKASVGFALNGPFVLDAGRGSLARDNTTNTEFAEHLGREIGTGLTELFDQSRRDWPKTRTTLNLRGDLDEHDFWYSLWTGLCQGWMRRSRDEATELVSITAITALTRLGGRPAAIPNGLELDYRCLIDRDKIQYALDETIAKSQVLRTLIEWNRFKQRYPKDACVSRSIADILRRTEIGKLHKVGLAAVIAVLSPEQVDSADATMMGRVQALTVDHSDWRTKDTRTRLAGLRFKTDAGGWAPAKDLLAEVGTTPEERLRHALAPTNRQLHNSYISDSTDQPALDFFLHCRQQHQVGSEKLADWILSAETSEEKYSALHYLAEGELSAQVADRVRGREWLASILANDKLLARLDEEQQDRVRRALASSEQMEKACRDDADETSAHAPPKISLASALQHIAAWWSDEQVEQLAKYEQQLYPNADLKLSEDEHEGFDDDSWLTLLTLAAFQSLGNTEEKQHRGFIEHCRAKGWWQTFANTDPRQNPEAWMDVIENYAEGQHDDEKWSQWFAFFPKIYRLKRWLDDYRTVFLSADFDQPFELGNLLAARANPDYQGTDIDPPPLSRTLRIGAPMVIRELLRHGVVNGHSAHPNAYAPITRIRYFFERFGEEVDTSTDIHDLLREHLGDEGACFDGAYDIPLRLITLDPELQYRLFT